MKIKALVPMAIVLGGLIATSGCHHVHRDFHNRHRHHRRYKADRDRHHEHRHDNGRHRGWDKH
jgi:hypothetical protein